ncbi:MAG: hypothetical protein AABZ44_04125 [Elusimicrobiota bacterium]
MKKILALLTVILTCSQAVFADIAIPVSANPMAMAAQIGQNMEGAASAPKPLPVPGPVLKDGTRLVTSQPLGPETMDCTGGQCHCNRWETVEYSNGESKMECRSWMWQPGRLIKRRSYQDTFEVVDPETYAASKARSSGITSGLMSGFGLGAAAWAGSGLLLHFVAKKTPGFAAGVGAVTGLAVGIAAGFYFSSQAKGPAYDEALRRAKTTPVLPPVERTVENTGGVCGQNPPLGGSPCSPFGTSW